MSLKRLLRHLRDTHERRVKLPSRPVCERIHKYQITSKWIVCAISNGLGRIPVGSIDNGIDMLICS